MLMLCWGAFLSTSADAKQLDSRPNVLMIAVDDLNHWVRHLNRNTQVKTPNIDGLAAKGMSFHRAYAPSAICNATRASMLTGMRPSTTGIYRNSIDWRSVVGDGYTLPGFFKEHGYYVAGGGKLFHKHTIIRKSDWHEYYSRKGKRYPPEKRGKIKGRTIRYKAGNMPISEIAAEDDNQSDYHVAQWAVSQVEKKHDKPFFIAAGIFRPHLPWSVPKKYFELYPEEDIQLPPYKEDDLNDLPYHVEDAPEHAKVLKEGSWKKAIRAYMASVTFADRQVGRILDALEKGPNKDNTIIVLWGDHGWHLGEKHRWRKSALWEEATRTPYIWYVPGLTKAGSKTDTPVDTQSLWSTLAALLDLPLPSHVEGENILPLLKNPNAKWSVPAITTYHFNNHAIRSKEFRYISYDKGGKELYDHRVDPYEWTNLALNDKYKDTIKSLDRWIPKANRGAEEAREMFGGETKYLGTSKKKDTKPVTDHDFEG